MRRRNIGYGICICAGIVIVGIGFYKVSSTSPRIAVQSTEKSNSRDSGADATSKETEIALDGYCPVNLVARSLWVKGDNRCQVTFEGQTYLLANEESLRLFSDNPRRYTPFLGGLDPVLYLSDPSQCVLGSREWGVYYQDRFFLFANESSLKAFETRPDDYALAELENRRSSQFAAGTSRGNTKTELK